MFDADQSKRCHFWLLDTRNIWPGKNIVDAAPKALELLSEEEQEKARKFHFLKDAKLSVASALLKRLFAVKELEVPWHQAEFQREGDPTHGKPCCVIPHQYRDRILDFNISHQAGLVCLAGCSNFGAKFGVDIVCTNERNNLEMVERESFESWIEMYTDIFSDEDIREMKNGNDLLAEARGLSPRQKLETRLQKFFAYWCLKEAYIKLEGEALLAPWLREVTFRNVRCPKPGTNTKRSSSQAWGEVVDDIQVWFRGRRVTDVKMVLQAFEDNYMIGTAIKEGTEAIPEEPSYALLKLDRDVYYNARP
ncbi:MAG: hypothetical protein M1831_000044 [Alyxoria varia]|nr:MAG: hypothetical protein M1831_000044 [Alyxoria varia]